MCDADCPVCTGKCDVKKQHVTHQHSYGYIAHNSVIHYAITVIHQWTEVKNEQVA